MIEGRAIHGSTASINTTAQSCMPAHNWFGNRRFSVHNIDDHGILSQAEDMGLTSRFINGQRTQLGRILTEMNGSGYRIAPGHEVRLAVIEFADDSKPAIYQLEDVPV